MHRYPRQKGQLFAANTFTTSLTPLQVSKMLVNVTIVVRRPTKGKKNELSLSLFSWARGDFSVLSF